jgi:hypothetical protein
LLILPCVGGGCFKDKQLTLCAEAPLSGQDKTWVALVSGLSVGAQEAPADLKTQLLVEWLTGESGGPSVSRRPPQAIAHSWAFVFQRTRGSRLQDQLEGARVARLILAGNSLTMPVRGTDDKQPVSDEVRTPARPRTASDPARLHPGVVVLHPHWIVSQSQPTDDPSLRNDSTPRTKPSTLPTRPRPSRSSSPISSPRHCPLTSSPAHQIRRARPSRNNPCQV